MDLDRGLGVVVLMKYGASRSVGADALAYGAAGGALANSPSSFFLGRY